MQAAQWAGVCACVSVCVYRAEEQLSLTAA